MKVVIDLLFKSGADRHIIAESESTKQALEELYSMQLEPVDGGAYSIEENEIAFVYASPYDGSLYHAAHVCADQIGSIEEDQQDDNWEFTDKCYPENDQPIVPSSDLLKAILDKKQ